MKSKKIFLIIGLLTMPYSFASFQSQASGASKQYDKLSTDSSENKKPADTYIGKYAITYKKIPFGFCSGSDNLQPIPCNKTDLNLEEKNPPCLFYLPIWMPFNLYLFLSHMNGIVANFQHAKAAQEYNSLYETTRDAAIIKAIKEGSITCKWKGCNNKSNMLHEVSLETLRIEEYAFPWSC